MKQEGSIRASNSDKKAASPPKNTIDRENANKGENIDNIEIHKTSPNNQDLKNQESKQNSTYFPVGEYSYATGSMRGNLIIDPNGFANIEEVSAGNGKTYNYKYKLEIDETVTVQENQIVYKLIPINSQADTRALPYYKDSARLSDITSNFDWIKI